jgi:hypothetical protein
VRIDSVIGLAVPNCSGEQRTARDVRERSEGIYNNPSKQLGEEIKKKVFGMFLMSWENWCSLSCTKADFKYETYQWIE